MSIKLLWIALISPLILSAPLYSQIAMTPREVIDLFEERLAAIADYQCRMYEWSAKGRREEIRYINFYFKQPRLIRMDIIKGNRSGDTGSIGVLRSNGKVQGRKGGLLSPFVISVDKESALATTIRGVTFDQSDAKAALERLRFLMERSRLRFSGKEEGWLFDFHLVEPEEGITRETLFLSSENIMPLYTESFEGDELVQTVQWRSYIINAGLPDEFFDVRYESEKLRDLRLNHNLDLPLELKK